MTAFTAPTIGDKVRNIYTGREFVVLSVDVTDFGQGAGPEVTVRVVGDRGTDDVWSGKVTAFEPVAAEAVEEAAPSVEEAAAASAKFPAHDAAPWTTSLDMGACKVCGALVKRATEGGWVHAYNLD